MGTAMITKAPEFLERVIEDGIDGDVAEIGILGGGTFKKLLTLAKPDGRKCHGFDSFEGMAEASPEHDYRPDGSNPYPKGKFSGHSFESVASKMEMEGFEIGTDFHLYKGWVPDVFEKAAKDLRFAFVYLDLDHFQPTLEALRFAWSRLAVGGIILCDDYLEEINRLATKAIKKWANNEMTFGTVIEVEGPKNQIAFRKLDEAPW